MRIPVAVIIAVLLAAAPAAPAQARDKALQEAKQLFTQAEKHFKLGRFEEALEAYSRAYEAKPLPGFLFNIGQCHRNLKQWEQAIHFYKSFLREVEDAANKETVEELIAQCQAELDKQRAAEQEAREHEEQAERDRLAAEQEKARLQAEVEKEKVRAELEKARLEAETQAALAAAAAPPPGAEESSPPVYRTWWFWTIIGGVAAAAIAGGVAGGLAAGQETRTVLPAGSLGARDLRTQ